MYKAYMPTLERLKTVGRLGGLASPLPDFFSQKDAKWCILFPFGNA